MFDYVGNDDSVQELVQNDNEEEELEEDDKLVVRNDNDEVEDGEDDQLVVSEDEVEEEDEESEIVVAAAALQPFRFQPERSRPGPAAPPNPRAGRVGNSNW